VTIEIEPSACARFTGAVVRGVKVAASPDWLRRRLESVGQRSVNNVVDATNYIMLELGQPMHAYDLGRLRGHRVIARRARAGETLVTLDGVERKLTPEMTVIADAQGAVGVAGVMGGSGSEVSEATTEVFLECAWFDPKETRATRKQLSLLTDASQRFERGTDLWGVPDALRRGLMVLEAVAGGTVDGEPADCWPAPVNPLRIFLRTRRVAQVLGVELSRETLEQCLVAIGATVVNKPDEHRIAVEVPGWRPDLREEIDLIEEVARIYGYSAFPDELRPFRAGNQVDAPITRKLDMLRRHLAAEGLYEAVLLPLGPGDAEDAVPVLNPLSSEHGFLRASLRSGLVRQVESNWASQVRDVRLFELGTVFRRAGRGSLPEEATHAAAVLTGARAPQHWTDGGHPPDCDEWDIRGVFERALSLANPTAAVQVEGTGWIARLPDGRTAGWAGRLDADAPPWAAPLFGMEVTVDPAPAGIRRYQPLPVTPAAIRDLALIVPAGVTAEAVVESVRRIAGTLLESIQPIDEYRGKGLPAGARSLAFRLVFRSRDRTLRDGDVDLMIQRILAHLGSIDVVIRAS
jgi:phenylalanyl-tRNA synthetase beta chain